MSDAAAHVLVLCEGKEDRLVFEKVASIAGLKGMAFEDYGGKDNLRNELTRIKDRPEFTRKQFRIIAVTRDADDSHDRAWQSLCGSIRAGFGIELSQPGSMVQLPDPDYVSDPKVSVTAWVLPGDGSPGMIESLCLQSVSDRPAYRCLSDYAQCLEALLPEEAGALESSGLHPKARFHAWVVSQTDFKDKDYNISTAVEEDRLEWNHPAFDGLRTFLRGLIS